MQHQETSKQKAALAAIDFIQHGMVIGVGTGSTVDHFIAALQKVKQKIEGAVASSRSTENKLKALSIPILDLNFVGDIPLYVDGADEITSSKCMIKGGGGALTREKIIATAAKKFVCIADDSKLVEQLGAYPVAIEVIPLGRSYVARQIVQLGGDPVYREGFITDNGNIILDIYNFNLLAQPLATFEQQLKSIVGVVESGIFAKRAADILLLGSMYGVNVL